MEQSSEPLSEPRQNLLLYRRENNYSRALQTADYTCLVLVPGPGTLQKMLQSSYTAINTGTTRYWHLVVLPLAAAVGFRALMYRR